MNSAQVRKAPPATAQELQPSDHRRPPIGFRCSFHPRKSPKSTFYRFMFSAPQSIACLRNVPSCVPCVLLWPVSSGDAHGRPVFPRFLHFSHFPHQTYPTSKTQHRLHSRKLRNLSIKIPRDCTLCTKFHFTRKCKSAPHPASRTFPTFPISPIQPPRSKIQHPQTPIPHPASSPDIQNPASNMQNSLAFPIFLHFSHFPHQPYPTSKIQNPISPNPHPAPRIQYPLWLPCRSGPCLPFPRLYGNNHLTQTPRKYV